MSGPLLEKKFDKIIKLLRNQQSSSSSCLKSNLKQIGNLNKPTKLDLELNKNFLLQIEHSPTIELFNSIYFQTKTPVIIDGQMSHWPAIQKWR